MDSREICFGRSMAPIPTHSRTVSAMSRLMPRKKPFIGSPRPRGEQLGRNVELECSRGREVQDQLVASRQLDRQIARLCAFEDAATAMGSVSQAP
jgi:hypothetical protein